MEVVYSKAVATYVNEHRPKDKTLTPTEIEETAKRAGLRVSYSVLMNGIFTMPESGLVTIHWVERFQDDKLYYDPYIYDYKGHSTDSKKFMQALKALGVETVSQDLLEKVVTMPFPYQWVPVHNGSSTTKCFLSEGIPMAQRFVRELQEDNLL